MKRWFRNAPIRQRLIAMILCASSLVLFLACVGFFAYGFMASRASTVRSISTVGRVIAAESTSALVLGNEAEARGILRALASEPGILAASLYRSDGTHFVHYPESIAPEELPPRPGPDGQQFADGRLRMFQPVIQAGGERVGTLYIETDLKVYRLIGGYAVVVLVMFALAGGASYGIARVLQHWISDPILSLSETARQLSQSHDFSARATRREGGELGELTDAFNVMLSQVEEQSRQVALSERRHRLLFDNSPLPMWVYDLETRRIVAVNESATLAYGYSYEEFLVLTVEDIRLPGELRRPDAGGPGLWNHRKKDGTVIIVEITTHDLVIDGRPSRVVLANDVTARLRAEGEVRESEARNRAILNSALTAVVVIDAAGLIIEWNARAETIFGWSRGEALGGDLSEMIVPSAYRERHRRGLRHFLATGEGPMLERLVELSALRRDGSEFPIELSISPIRTGERTTFCGFITDTTQRKKAEAEILQLNSELEQRIRQRTAQLEAANEELESFSYSVSHDLRAPLRHVQGYVSLLEREVEGQLSGKARRYLRIISDASVEMGQLIDDLLEFSRMGRAELREARVRLGELVENSVAALELTTAGRKINWRIGQLPIVMGDASMLRQVFGNVIGNAVKYTRQRDPAEIEIGTAGTEEGRVVVFVRDNGAGFDMNYAHKLFGVFQRLHRSDEFEGTGIGLATVRRVVSRHGGRVWAESALGKGATFYFTLQPADPPLPNGTPDA